MKPILCPPIMDIEASGFGTLSYPIEVGVVKSDGESYCALIKPSPNWQHWNHDAEQIHGISRSTIEASGLCLRRVCQELNHFLADGQVFSDALTHDQWWLTKLFSSAELHQTFQLRAIEHILSEEQVGVWDLTKTEIEAQMGLIRHRASSDAFLIQQTYLQSKIRLKRSSVAGE